MLNHNQNKIKIPSKTFLTGEYAVLRGGEALVLTHAPFFKAHLDESGESFHPKSPAGILEKNMTGEQKIWKFEDPHRGAGGFGGSTAEFLSVYKTLCEEPSLVDAMRHYFRLFENDKNSPSGADLCAQYNEELGLTLYKKEPYQSKSLKWPFDEISILVYKTNVKVKTHKHLEEVEGLDFSGLKKESSNFIEALKNQDSRGLFSAVDAFSKEQARLGLLLKESQTAVKTINQIEGVFTSRGCGAMGADVITVFVKKERQDYVESAVDAANLDLNLVSKG